MGYFVVFLLGAVTCWVIVAVSTVLIADDGYLRIDHSDPSDDPYLFLEISKPVEELSKKHTVIFSVKNENFVSRDKQ